MTAWDTGVMKFQQHLMDITVHYLEQVTEKVYMTREKPLWITKITGG